jgi:pimeloyl-ACP methyl ester carboxylesterase
MKKIFRFLGYSLITILVIAIVAFVFYYQPDRSLADMRLLYANANSQFMPLMGMNVHYRDEGNNRDSVPLVLIHGTSSSLNTFDSVVLNLKEKRRVITLDMPAFGMTGPNPENNYSFDYYSQFLDSFLTRLNVTQCDIGGNSLGGGISWEFAVAHPEKVRKLILIDATGYPVKNAKGSIGFKLASTPIINNLLLYITPKALVRASLQSIYFDSLRVTQAQVDRFHDMAISKGNRAALLSMFKSGRKHNEQLISTIIKPTLIIWGDHDNLIPVENAYLFEKNIKGSKLVILKDIGHVPMEECPKKLATLIAEF